MIPFQLQYQLIFHNLDYKTNGMKTNGVRPENGKEMETQCMYNLTLEK